MSSGHYLPVLSRPESYNLASNALGYLAWVAPSLEGGAYGGHVTCPSTHTTEGPQCTFSKQLSQVLSHMRRLGPTGTDTNAAPDEAWLKAHKVTVCQKCLMVYTANKDNSPRSHSPCNGKGAAAGSQGSVDGGDDDNHQHDDNQHDDNQHDDQQQGGQQQGDQQQGRIRTYRAATELSGGELKRAIRCLSSNGVAKLGEDGVKEAITSLFPAAPAGALPAPSPSTRTPRS